jgi:hypothetical protein
MTNYNDRIARRAGAPIGDGGILPPHDSPRRLRKSKLKLILKIRRGIDVAK